MKNLILTSIPFLPVIGEIIFDKWRWKNGLSDKPLSTQLRVISFIVLAIIMAFIVGAGNAWIVLITAGLYLYGTHLLFFDYSLNLSRRPRKHIFYHSDNDYWFNFKLFGRRFALPMNSIPWYGELLWKLIIAWSTWIAFFHWNWIQGDYPSRLIEYFMY